MTRPPWPSPPRGFVRIDSREGALYAREVWADAIRHAGLGSREAWFSGSQGGEGRPGRGATSRRVLPGLPPLVVKRLLRGGLRARAGRPGFRRPERLLANLHDPDVLAGRGVATPRAAALLMFAGAGERLEGCLAVEEIEGAIDLRRRWSGGTAAPDDLDAALSVVRAMHDAGYRHRDLNLGNLLLRDADPRAFIIDLDGGRWSPAPLGPGGRAASLRRLERSYVKLFGDPGPLGPGGRDRFWTGYAPDDRALGSALRLRRWTGKLSVAWHRLGWTTPEEAGRGDAP